MDSSVCGFTLALGRFILTKTDWCFTPGNVSETRGNSLSHTGSLFILSYQDFYTVIVLLQYSAVFIVLSFLVSLRFVVFLKFCYVFKVYNLNFLCF